MSTAPFLAEDNTTDFILTHTFTEAWHVDMRFVNMINDARICIHEWQMTRLIARVLGKDTEGEMSISMKEKQTSS